MFNALVFSIKQNFKNKTKTKISFTVCGYGKREKKEKEFVSFKYRESFVDCQIRNRLGGHFLFASFNQCQTAYFPPIVN